MEKFQEVLDMITRHHHALGYGLGNRLTAGEEPIFSTVLFQCSCSATRILPYGLALLLVPALTLFVLTYVIRAPTWRPLTCCCARGDSSGTDHDTCCGGDQSELPVRAQLSGAAALGGRGAAAGQLHWVAVALLGAPSISVRLSGSCVMARFLCQGRDSSCMDQLPLVSCKKAPEPAVQGLLMELRAQSQIMGWILIVVGMIFFLIITSVTRCQSPVDYMQQKFKKIYMEQEQKIFRSEAPKHATELAEQHVTCFFGSGDPKEYYTPSPCDWQISSLRKARNQYYSSCTNT